MENKNNYIVYGKDDHDLPTVSHIERGIYDPTPKEIIFVKKLESSGEITDVKNNDKPCNWHKITLISQSKEINEYDIMLCRYKTSCQDIFKIYLGHWNNGIIITRK